MAVKKGDKIKVNYACKLQDGTVCDSSEQRGPLEFEVGSGKMIPGFDEAVVGMEVSESKSIEVAADKAYGERSQERVMIIEKGQLPPEYQPSVGDILQSSAEDGMPMMAKVIEVGDDSLTLDANHPLAGQDLVFEIEIVEIAG